MKTLRQIITEAKLVDNLAGELESHYDNNSLDNEQSNVLKAYTRNYASQVNSHLWNRYQGNGHIEDDKEHANNIKTLDSFVNRKRTPKDITVYSSTRHNPKNIEDKDGIVNHPAYFSGSISPHVALRRASFNNKSHVDGERHVIRIVFPKDWKGGGYVGNHSNSRDELEYLAKRGLRMRHTGKIQKIKYNKPKKDAFYWMDKDTSYNQKKALLKTYDGIANYIHVHHMELVPDKKEE
jgi:hypothetical protein